MRISRKNRDGSVPLRRHRTVPVGCYTFSPLRDDLHFRCIECKGIRLNFVLAECEQFFIRSGADVDALDVLIENAPLLARVEGLVCPFDAVDVVAAVLALRIAFFFAVVVFRRRVRQLPSPRARFSAR